MTLQILLTDVQFAELETRVAYHPKYYMRERASAVFKLQKRRG